MSRPDRREENAAGFYPAAVVWDLDGTLVESAPDLANALNRLLAEHSLPQHTVDEVRLMIGAGVPTLLERGFKKAGLHLNEAERDALAPRFMAFYLACATDNTHLVPGARYVLDRMHRAGMPQGLCTNKPEGVTRDILDTLGISHYFGSVIGGDSTSGKKPDPTPLLACLDELGVSPSDAVMVGDSAADTGAARAAGVYAIVVPNGYTGEPPEALISQRPATIARKASSEKWKQRLTTTLRRYTVNNRHR